MQQHTDDPKKRDDSRVSASTAGSKGSRQKRRAKEERPVEGVASHPRRTNRFSGDYFPDEDFDDDEIYGEVLGGKSSTVRPARKGVKSNDDNGCFFVNDDQDKALRSTSETTDEKIDSLDDALPEDAEDEDKNSITKYMEYLNHGIYQNADALSVVIEATIEDGKVFEFLEAFSKCYDNYVPKHMPGSVPFTALYYIRSGKQ